MGASSVASLISRRRAGPVLARAPSPAFGRPGSGHEPGGRWIAVPRTSL